MISIHKKIIYWTSGIILLLFIASLLTASKLSDDVQFISVTDVTTNTPINESKNEVCVDMTVLYYHHVQSMKAAVKKQQVGLTVDTNQFDKHLNYLFTHGYTVIGIEEVINSFNTKSPLPNKSIMLTFDDGYDDFYTDVFPLLKKYNYPAVMFLPTGLLNRRGYLTWEQVKEMEESNLVYFANHTFTHSEMIDSFPYISEQIERSEKMLELHNLNKFKVFAYPYGTIGDKVLKYLGDNDYTLAFTTKKGQVLCYENRLLLPRTGVLNKPLELQKI